MCTLQATTSDFFRPLAARGLRSQPDLHQIQSSSVQESSAHEPDPYMLDLSQPSSSPLIDAVQLCGHVDPARPCSHVDSAQLNDHAVPAQPSSDVEAKQGTPSRANLAPVLRRSPANQPAAARSAGRPNQAPYNRALKDVGMSELPPARVHHPTVAAEAPVSSKHGDVTAVAPIEGSQVDRGHTGRERYHE